MHADNNTCYQLRMVLKKKNLVIKECSQLGRKKKERNTGESCLCLKIFLVSFPLSLREFLVHTRRMLSR